MIKAIVNYSLFFIFIAKLYVHFIQDTLYMVSIKANLILQDSIAAEEITDQQTWHLLSSEDNKLTSLTVTPKYEEELTDRGFKIHFFVCNKSNEPYIVKKYCGILDTLIHNTNKFEIGTGEIKQVDFNDDMRLYFWTNKESKELNIVMSPIYSIYKDPPWEAYITCIEEKGN